MTDTWASRFTPAHVPAGSPAGGQFAPASGASQAGKNAGDKRPVPGNQHPVGMGEHGKRVSDLQARLNALGFKPPLKVDGIFGPKTLAAVKAFQRSHGLKTDGLVGPHTTAALRGKPGPAAKPSAKGTPHVKAAPAGKSSHAGVMLSGKPGSITSGQQAEIRQLVKDRKVPGPDAADATAPAAMKALAASEAAALIKHLRTFPARTATRALAHEKVGHTGQGLWHGKNRQLPAFIQHVANDLIAQRGMSESQAIATAVAVCKKWAAGGQDVKPETRAKAAAAVAEWERLKAGAHGKTSAPQGGGMSRSELFRSYPLEDYHIVRTGEGDSSGRVVEAYMTVFDEEAEIYDGQGRYREAIDRAAFNKRIADLERSRNGFAAAKVFYNHGMTIHGTPSDRYSMPTAVCEGIRADTRGPVTRSRYLDTPLGNEVLEMWRSGAVTAQSFTGAIIRSSPELKPGEKYRPRNGQLPQVRRLELGLKEYGPTPFPAYTGAELVGVRMSPLGTWQAADDDETEEADEIGDEALPPDEEAATGGPPDVHPTRDHAHRLYALRTEQLCREAGIASLKGGW